MMGMIDLDRLLWIVIAAAVAALVGRITKLIDEARADREEQRRHREEEARAKEAHDTLNDAALRYLLKDRLNQACDYWQTQGYCTNHSREVLTEMAGIYSQLGGNSFIHDELQRTMSLPTRERRDG